VLLRIAPATIGLVAQTPEQPDLERADRNRRHKDHHDRQKHFRSPFSPPRLISARIGGVVFVFGSCAVVGEPRLADYRGGPPSESPVSHTGD
jgi:hypothetical protein